VERLTPAEIQRLLDECDPDDPNMPPSMRCAYKCEKEATGTLNKKALLDFIHDQALNTPDVPENVPFVVGTVRGKKWQAPPKPEPQKMEEEIELDIDFGEECELALSSASTDQIVDLAGILGLHSMMNQEQFHSAQSDKWASRPDPNVGWNGITKSTPLKVFPPEEPNRTDPEEVLTKLRDGDKSMEKVNLNNVPMSEERLLDIFDAIRNNEVLVDLSMANCMIGDFAACNLACALENNKWLEVINIESNNVSPQTLIKIFEAANVQQTLKVIKASNQQAQFLGNRVEVAVTKAVEKNKTLLRVGLHFEFGDCRNRVAVQLQKNLDRQRLKRIAHKLSTAGAEPEKKAVTNGSSGSRTGGLLGALPGTLSNIPRQKSPGEVAAGDDDEYEYYEEEEEESGGDK
jgi:tropomodulin